LTVLSPVPSRSSATENTLAFMVDYAAPIS
jgi:hypothetical protein